MGLKVELNQASLDGLIVIFNSGCGPVLGRICSTGKQLGSGAGQVILRQEGRQSGPGGMPGEFGIMAGWGGELIGEKTGTWANCTSGKLEVSLCGAGPRPVLQKPDC